MRSFSRFSLCQWQTIVSTSSRQLDPSLVNIKPFKTCFYQWWTSLVKKFAIWAHELRSLASDAGVDSRKKIPFETTMIQLRHFWVRALTEKSCFGEKISWQIQIRLSWHKIWIEAMPFGDQNISGNIALRPVNLLLPWTNQPTTELTFILLYGYICSSWGWDSRWDFNPESMTCILKTGSRRVQGKDYPAHFRFCLPFSSIRWECVFFCVWLFAEELPMVMFESFAAKEVVVDDGVESVAGVFVGE